ncbi:hypothetical protein DPEC_G00096690 [Dallia pectoralis]|uniref:Uncharacterized protein n=1 Tax=Dallia pectoralis TaxID=75939 RepID=A0ACC2GVJ8_DALPE|nr:hypothetical protein DPEC_G00096690 [Dallia pectoralis]
MTPGCSYSCAVITTVNEVYNIQCNGMKGRYLVLFIPGVNKILCLCEVEVYGSIVIKQQVVKVKLATKDTNMNLTNPFVQEAILQQLKEKMSGNIKLRWKEQPDGNIFHTEEKEKKQDCLSVN